MTPTEVMCNGCGSLVDYPESVVILQGRYKAGDIGLRQELKVAIHCWAWYGHETECPSCNRGGFWFYEVCPEAGINGFPIKRVSSNV